MDGRNKVRERLEANRIAVGTQAWIFSPTLVEVYGNLGFDFVWLDFEHIGQTPYDSTLFENLTRAAENANTELLARLPSGRSEPLIRKVLDAGVRNLLIPRVETAAEVRSAVEASRYRYDGDAGERGVGPGRGTNWAYDQSPDYCRREDRNVLVGVMIENTNAVENIDDILTVPNLGFAVLGPMDLSVSAGHPAEPDHPDVRSLIERIEVACADSDVSLGYPVGTAADAKEAIERGGRLISMGSEISAVREHLGEGLAALSEYRE